MFPNDLSDDNTPEYEYEPEYIPPELPTDMWESDPLWADYPEVDAECDVAEIEASSFYQMMVKINHLVESLWQEWEDEN